MMMFQSLMNVSTRQELNYYTNNNTIISASLYKGNTMCNCSHIIKFDVSAL